LAEDYELGEKASSLYLNYISKPDFHSLNLSNSSHMEVLSYNKIYQKLLTIPSLKNQTKIKTKTKQVFCFVTEGGFEPWSGKSLLTTGLGGSETYIIKMAQCIQAHTDFEVIVFCPCKYKESFRGVLYTPIEGLAKYLFTHSVQHCLVSRYSEYIPLCLKGWTENVYLMVHDLTCSGIVIPTHPKLKRIFCLTYWHVQYFSGIFPSLKHLITPFNNGTDMRYFDKKDFNKLISNLTPIQFIYSSFPNRGLLPLLQMWESIQEIYPMSQLHIYCNLENDYVKTVAQEEIKEIKYYLNQLQNVNMHGWVKKEELEIAWNNADVWLYPCTFQETFCITALEAAKTKTLVISTDLAGLKETVADRGILISGDPLTKEWQKEALKQLNIYMENPLKRNHLIEKNYHWASQLSWDKVAQHFLNNYVIQNNFEYMNNFTIFELNRSSIYLNILNQKQENVVSLLHIDCHTGSVLVDFLKKISLQRVQGVGINPTSQETFKNNISREKLNDSIKCLEGDNTLEILTCLLQENPIIKYDFIYLEEEKEEKNKTHFYLKCWLGWNLLKDSGVFCLFSRENISEIIQYVESTFQNIIYRREENFLCIQKK
jgi:glycosyltransferase involved in cell wall biosynthesis